MDDGEDHIDGATTEESERARGASPGTENSARDIEVPLRVYKTVTVFSTLIAVICVVGGFLLLDIATNRGQARIGAIDPAIAVIGLLGIAAGAVVYAFSTRFRAAGMGTSKDDGE